MIDRYEFVGNIIKIGVAKSKENSKYFSWKFFIDQLYGYWKILGLGLISGGRISTFAGYLAIGYPAFSKPDIRYSARRPDIQQPIPDIKPIK